MLTCEHGERRRESTGKKRKKPLKMEIQVVKNIGEKKRSRKKERKRKI